MAYVMVKQPQAWWPVEWDGVDPDGTIVPRSIKMRFRLLKDDEGRELLAEIRAAEAEEAKPEVDRAATYATLVEKIATDWGDIAYESGDAIPWSSANLRDFLNEQGRFLVVLGAFRDCLAARPKVREGN